MYVLPYKMAHKLAHANRKGNYIFTIDLRRR